MLKDRPFDLRSRFTHLSDLTLEIYEYHDSTRRAEVWDHARDNLVGSGREYKDGGWKVGIPGEAEIVGEGADLASAMVKLYDRLLLDRCGIEYTRRPWPVVVKSQPSDEEKAKALEALKAEQVPSGNFILCPACRVSRARVVDAGRIVTAGGIASGMEMGFHLLRRAGYDEAFVADVARALANSGMPAELLELEITESIAMDEPRIVRQSLEALKHLGVRIAIDDFGTGYSSLGQLQNLPIDRLKIDRTFVKEIKAGNGGLYAETIIGLAGELKVESVAEGVETSEQAAFLSHLGCTTAQGWLYGRALPPAELDQWLRSPPPPGLVVHCRPT
jgi:hypothetical protein